MRIQTILNRLAKFQSFVYGTARWTKGLSGPALEVALRPRKNSQPICLGCQKKRPGYDTLSERRFHFVPFWGVAVFFLYARRRGGLSSPRRGVRSMDLGARRDVQCQPDRKESPCMRTCSAS